MGGTGNWKSLVAVAVACAGGGFGAGAEPGCDGPLAGPDSYANNSLRNVWASARWDPDGSGPEREWIVFGGSAADSIDNAQGPVWRWDGQRIRSLGDATAMANMQVSSLTVWNDRLVAMSGTATRPQAFVLNDGVWTPLPTNLTAGTANRLISYRGELVVAGLNFQINGAVSSVMVYRDGKWLPLGPPISGMCNDLIEFEGQLVVCGRTGNPSVSPFTLRWDGVEWKPMGPTWRGSEVKRLIVFDGRLVAVGSMTGSGSRDFLNAAAWNGSEWLGMGYTDAFGPVHVAAHDDVLYATSFRSLWRWDRQRWTKLEPPGSVLRGPGTMLAPFDGDLLLFNAGVTSGPFGVNALSVARLVRGELRAWEGVAQVAAGMRIRLGTTYQGKLFASGALIHCSGVKAKSVGVWDGVTWECIDQGLVGGFNITSLESFSGGVLAAGDISGVIDPSTGATVPTNGIARWDGARWHPFGEDLPSAARSLAIDGDRPVVAVDVPSLIPGRSQILRWTPQGWTSLGELPGLATDMRMVASGGSLAIAGADRDEANQITGKYIAMWDGDHWNRIFESREFFWEPVLAFHEGTLYSNAPFRNADKSIILNLFQWDGSMWKEVGRGPGFFISSILSDANGDLLVGGSDSNGARVSRWSGAGWTDVQLGATVAGQIAGKLVRHHNELVALGLFGINQFSTNPIAARRINTGSNAWIAWQPKGMEIVCGGSTTLRARVANGYVVASATWFRNGVPVVADRIAGVRVEFEGGHAVLRLDDVSSDVAGTYRCVFETACGTLESDPAVVTVTGVCCPGDLTLDGVVDDADFMAFAQAYFTMTCDSAKMRPGCAADLDGDGLVGDTDFEVFALAYDAFVCPG